MKLRQLMSAPSPETDVETEPEPRPSRERTPLGLRRGGRILALALLLAFAVWTAQILVYGKAPMDDAFISLRYARNLAEGHGLVFNPGERVEGYTNFLWTLLLALPFELGIDPIDFTYGLGIFSGALLVFAAWKLARALAPERPLAAGLAALLAAATPYLIAESIMGLETALFAALAALGLAFYLQRPERPWGSALALAAAALTRPEGLLVVGWVGLHDLVRTSRAREGWKGFAARWAVVAAVVGGHLVFRVAYYGDVVPNTFHAKVGVGWSAISRGLEYARDFALCSVPLIALGLLGALPARGREARLRWASAWVLGLALAYGSYAVYVGGDFRTTYRFFALPALLLAVLAGDGAARCGELVRRAPRASALALAAVGALVLLLPMRLTLAFVRQRAELYPLHLAIGAWLREHFPPDALVATVNVGAVPYESRLPALDLVGLCDRHIASVEEPDMGLGIAGHEKSDPDYVLDRRPAIVLFQSARLSPEPLRIEQMDRRLQWRAEHELWEHPRFRREYRLRSENIGFGWFNFFERVDAG